MRQKISSAHSHHSFFFQTFPVYDILVLIDDSLDCHVKRCVVFVDQEELIWVILDLYSPLVVTVLLLNVLSDSFLDAINSLELDSGFILGARLSFRFSV